MTEDNILESNHGDIGREQFVLLDPNLRKEVLEESIMWGNKRFVEIKAKDSDAVLNVSLAQFEQPVGIFKKGEIDLCIMGTTGDHYTSVNALFELGQPGYISPAVLENISTYFRDNGHNEVKLFNEDGKNKMLLKLGGFDAKVDFGYNSQADGMHAYKHVEPKKGFRYETIFVGIQVYDGEKPFVADAKVSEVVSQLIDVGTNLALVSQEESKSASRIVNWSGLDLDTKVYTGEDGRMVDGNGKLIGLVISPKNFSVTQTVAAANTSKL